MPWQPFRRKVKHRQLKEEEMETSFDTELLPRSASDGNLVRNHTVEEGETMAGLSLRYNITIQDIKLANKLWTNEGLWPGRTLRIPVIEVSSTSLDLSGSSGCASDTISTDSQVSGSVLPSAGGGPESSASSTGSSRRVSSSSHEYVMPPNNNSFNSSPISLPLQKPVQILQSLRNIDRCSSQPMATSPALPHRASVEDLSSFLNAMDSSIAINKKASISLIKSSRLKPDDREVLSRDREVSPVDFKINNNGTISGGRAQDGEVVISGGIDSIC